MEIGAPGVFLMALKGLFFCLFLSAGVQKLLDQNNFRTVVIDYDILPPFLIDVSIIVLPLVEIMAASLILIPGYSATGMTVAAALLTVYLVALGSVRWRNIELDDCGCGGMFHTQRLDAWPVVRNAVLIFMAALVLAFQDQTTGLGLAEWAIILPFSAFIVLLYWVFDQLWSNHRILSLMQAYYE